MHVGPVHCQIHLRISIDALGARLQLLLLLLCFTAFLCCVAQLKSQRMCRTDFYSATNRRLRQMMIPSNRWNTQFAKGFSLNAQSGHRFSLEIQSLRVGIFLLYVLPDQTRAHNSRATLAVGYMYLLDHHYWIGIKYVSVSPFS